MSCPRDKSPPIEVRISKFGPKMHLSIVNVPIDIKIDWSRSSILFLISNQLVFPNFASLIHLRRLYIFSETIASECSTSHMAPHIYWFLCIRTGTCHGPWNSPPLYLGETIGGQPASTRQLALDCTSCDRFSPYYIRFACRNFIYQH